MVDLGDPSPSTMANRQPEIIVAVTVTFGAATIILALRVVARKLRKVTLWLDDWLAVLAWVR